VDRQALVGERLFFSPLESGATRVHTLTVDASLREYKFNPGCRDLAGIYTCNGFAHTCATTPGWMTVNCAATCRVCHLMDPKVRCSLERLGLGNESAVGPGDIARMFESLPRRYPQYNVQFLSEPGRSAPDDPYVATFDNFVTAEEARVVWQLTEKNLARSTDQGAIDEATGVMAKVTSTARTSSNAWCDEPSGCATNPVVKKLIQRIADVVQVSEQNFEYMQVLRYQRGQEYRPHHDTNPADWGLACGPRLYTMFLYFEDVTEGGGTSFPHLNVTVTPEKLKALLWPSLVNDNPFQIEARTTHAALPVIAGTKFAANVWVRQGNYRYTNFWGCTGSFGEL
jgi:prolyl 4-hydroxylase